MASYFPDEGELVFANAVFKKVTTDLGTNMELGLFTNSTVSDSTAHSAITEPGGGDYGRKLLTDASWTVATNAGVTTATYAKQTFTAPTGAYTGTIYGYFICTSATTGSNKRLVALETLTSPITILQNDEFSVTPTITIA